MYVILQFIFERSHDSTKGNRKRKEYESSSPIAKVQKEKRIES